MTWPAQVPPCGAGVRTEERTVSTSAMVISSFGRQRPHAGRKASYKPFRSSRRLSRSSIRAHAAILPSLWPSSAALSLSPASAIGSAIDATKRVWQADRHMVYARPCRPSAQRTDWQIASW